MIIDSKLIAAGGLDAAGNITYQTVTGSGSALGANVVDLLANRDIGEGGALYLRAQIGAAFAGATAVEIQAVQADNAALSTNLSVVGSTGAIPTAKLTAGAKFAARLNPRLGQAGQRYLGARFVLTGTGTAGSVFADFGIEIGDGATGGKAYPSGFAVL
jgi:hypothetical protein